MTLAFALPLGLKNLGTRLRGYDVPGLTKNDTHRYDVPGLTKNDTHRYDVPGLT